MEATVENPRGLVLVTSQRTDYLPFADDIAQHLQVVAGINRSQIYTQTDIDVADATETWRTQWLRACKLCVGNGGYVLCLVDRTYLQSEFCCEEFNVAKGNRRAIVVAMEPLATLRSVPPQGKNGTALFHFEEGGQCLLASTGSAYDTPEKIAKFLAARLATGEDEGPVAQGKRLVLESTAGSLDREFHQFMLVKREGFVGRSNLFAKVDTWLLNPKGAPVLLLLGPAGSGKSSASAELVQQVDGSVAATERIIAHHICSARFEHWLEPVRFVQNVTKQLCRSLQPDFDQYLTKLREDAEEERKRREAKEAAMSPTQKARTRAPTQDPFQVLKEAPKSFQDVLKRDEVERPELYVQRLPISFQHLMLVLRKVPPSAINGVRMMVVDSLDEALLVKGGVKSIADVITDGLADRPSWLRIFATSRPDERAMGVLRRKAEVAVFEDTENARDVHRFVTERMYEEAKFQGWPDARVPEAIAHVSRAARGNFQYAASVQAQLRRGDMTLDDLGRLPDDLALFYEEVRVCPSTRRGRGSRRPTDAMAPSLLQSLKRKMPIPSEQREVQPILKVLVASRDALTIQEMRDVVACVWPSIARDEDDLFALVSRLDGFLVEEKSGATDMTTLRLHHQSVADWLADPTTRKRTPSLYGGGPLGHLAVGIWLLRVRAKSLAAAGGAADLPDRLRAAVDLLIGGEDGLLPEQKTVGSRRFGLVHDKASAAAAARRASGLVVAVSELVCAIAGDLLGHVQICGNLARGLDVDQVDRVVASAGEDASAVTPLLHAARGGDADVVAALLAAGATPDFDAGGDLTPLADAAARGHSDVCRVLLDSRAAVDGNGNPLGRAVLQGHAEVVDILLTAGASVDSEYDGQSLFLLASTKGHAEVTGRLIAAGASLDAPSLFGVTALREAARKGNLDLLKTLLDNSADVEKTDGAGCTPLYHAAARGQVDAMRLLLLRNANPKGRDTEGRAFFNVAVRMGRAESLRVWLVAGVDTADINSLDVMGRAPLHVAARWGGRETTKALLDFSATVAVRDGITGASALHAAVGWSRDADTIEELLLRKANPNATDDGGSTPLHRAAYLGREAAAEVLLLNKADPNIVDKYGATPLLTAVRGRHLVVVRVLIHAGAAVNKAPALQEAINDFHISEALIIAGADVNAVDKVGGTALAYALARGSEEVENLLMSAGATISPAELERVFPLRWRIATSTGYQDVVKGGRYVRRGPTRSPLLAAAWEGDTGAIRSLVGTPAWSVLVPDSDGRTPLMLAAVRGHADAAQALLDAKADVNAVDGGGWSALHYAARAGVVATVTTLVERGANLAADACGSTPLHDAVVRDRTAVVEALVRARAPVDATDVSAATPLAEAARWGRGEACDILLAAKANPNARDKAGFTPLLHAASRVLSPELHRKLLAGGADAKAAAEDGSTALHLCVRVHESIGRGFSPRIQEVTDCLKVLLAASADVGARDKRGQTAAALVEETWDGNKLASNGKAKSKADVISLLRVAA